MSTIHRVFRSDHSHLFRLMDLDQETDDLWKPDEFAEIWRRQLDAPLGFDLTCASPEARTSYAAATATTSTPPKTFRQLFGQPHPPIELLKIAKDFGKAQTKNRNPSLPSDLGMMLYLVSIAVALARCEQRITMLTNDKLRAGLKWAVARSWLDDPCRRCLAEALKMIAQQRIKEREI